MSKLNIRNTYPLLVIVIGSVHLGLVFALISFTFNPRILDKKIEQSSLNIVITEDVRELESETYKKEEIIKEVVEEVLEESKPVVTPVAEKAEVVQKAIVAKKPITNITKAVVTEKPQSTMANTQKEDVLEREARVATRKKIIEQYKRLKNAYNQDLERYLLKHKRFPALSRRFGHEGLVKYKVRIEKDGSFSRIVRTRSSGHESLDNESFNLLKQASGFKPLPRSLPFLTLNVPVEYNLH